MKPADDQNSKLVLVIEDNPLNMKLVRQLLLIGKYRILESTCSEDGLEIARRHHPDLILMDIQLPGMDGLAATRCLKEDPQLRCIPVVALTSFAMADDELKAREAGCDGVITKPINTRTFLQTISEYMVRSV